MAPHWAATIAPAVFAASRRSRYSRVFGPRRAPVAKIMFWDGYLSPTGKVMTATSSLTRTLSGIVVSTEEPNDTISVLFCNIGVELSARHPDVGDVTERLSPLSPVDDVLKLLFPGLPEAHARWPVSVWRGGSTLEALMMAAQARSSCSGRTRTS